MKVLKDHVVSFRYIMKNSKGDILEDTTGKEPTCYLHGSGAIQAALQQQMEGLTTHDKKLVSLTKETGLVDDDITFDIIVDDVREAFPEELRLGYPLVTHNEKCDADCDCHATREKIPRMSIGT